MILELQLCLSDSVMKYEERTYQALGSVHTEIPPSALTTYTIALLPRIRSLIVIQSEICR